ncbi:D-aminoacyl-tRNA deacylase [Uliginosibacterium gangwonense]|uniref:D-aminoacyl-tRNA deacylase n=1 Tax=Uliginosibacterium gangwonense TaxID=392736 RepID=UPI000374BBA7|nr:D-aminoacyl-tRNA deacylase [Uliginosibacterium gangwonense]
MIALIQRVRSASVEVDGQIVGKIGSGLLALIGVQKEDDAAKADRLLKKLLNYRVFADDEQRMNRSLRDTSGGLLLVSQFTLAADTHKGARPSFSSAATPDDARTLFDYLLARAQGCHPVVETGRFGTDMQVSLINDGPVTFWLET